MNIIAFIKSVVNSDYISSGFALAILRNESPKAATVIKRTKKKFFISAITSKIIRIKYPVYLKILKK